MWADGIHVNIRLEEHKLCLLVIIGVRADGTEELVALADGYRESAESWADLLRDAKRRGMRAPVLAVGDAALGFGGGLREVFLETREQRCWFHKTGNVLSALPKSAHPAAKKALAEIWGADDKAHTQAGEKMFADLFGAKFPKAVAKVTTNLDQLLAVYDYPGRTLVHLRTANPVESPPSRPCDTALRSPAGQEVAPPARRWHSDSSKPPKPAGAPSTHHTWSRSSEPAHASNTANSSSENPYTLTEGRRDTRPAQPQRGRQSRKAGAAPMIARTWRGWAPATTADDYQRHYQSEVAEHLQAVPGFCGARLLRRQDGEEVAFTSVAFFTSIAAVRKFAGPNYEQAVVEDTARRALNRWDEHVTHHQVAIDLQP